MRRVGGYLVMLAALVAWAGRDSAADLWHAYRRWCAAQSQPPACKSPTWFIRNLTQRHGLDLPRRHSGRLRGLGLRPGAEGESA